MFILHELVQIAVLEQRVVFFNAFFFFWIPLVQEGKDEPEFDYPFISPHPKEKEGALRKADEAENHHFCYIVSWVKLEMPSYILLLTALKSVC